ncbi:glycosyltransferase [Pseudanabaena sp. PCC 6802]|uniref:glycosyltransferase n=1 Tax=Pseudanabaena sp. PCC 6802 TaxID=118173 RepID=UPI0003475F61|nr:glycosyltransferase [Pseudanabaena sp. PCC 6802]
MPRVSVIIPSYNHKKYVAEAIQSVLDQTYQDFEIVITDDGSSDRTVSIIKSFTDPRIKLFCFPKNRGAAVAVNHCIAEAKGEFIALLNSDDVFVVDKLEKQVDFLDRNPQVGAVFSYAQFIDEDSQEIANTEHHYAKVFLQHNRSRFKWLNHFFYHGNCLCHPSILIRKECYDTVGNYDRRLAQLPDFDFWIRLCQKYEIFILPENLVKFRIRSDRTNASADTPESRIRISFETIQIYRNYLSLQIQENIKQIFPEIVAICSINDSKISKEIAPLFIAKLALQSERNTIKYFGILTIYQLLGENEFILSELKEKYDFDFTDLIKLTGKIEIFITPEILSTLSEAVPVANLVRTSRIWKLWEMWTRVKVYLKSKYQTWLGINKNDK